MDLATQGLLGAVIAQAGFQKKLGKKAVLWGAIGGMIPDLDVLSQLSSHNIDHLIWHRSFTHSLWFGPVLGTVMGLALGHYYFKRKEQHHESSKHLGAWVAMMVLAILTHPLLDLFTSYGTQLLAPFSQERFAIDALAIIDPFYSLPLLFALVFGMGYGLKSKKSIQFAVTALAFSTLYIGYAYMQNEKAKDLAQVALAQYEIQYDTLEAYPTLFQPWLRRFVAKNQTHAYTGELSTLSSHPTGAAIIREQPRFKDPMIEVFKKSHAGQVFEWFSMGQTWPQVWKTESGGTVVTLWDLRYPDFYLYDPQNMPRAELGKGIDALWGVRIEYDAFGRTHQQPYQYSREYRSKFIPIWKAVWRKTFDQSLETIASVSEKKDLL
jgi:inner membrane protein